ncbi:hypothetical protein [Proteiniborus sp.]|uniref:polysaccharide deacetylase WbmS family protein n=1 Tax=Proteiniborus sp. TaxID=2079015 RepID=UPI00331B2B74
MNMMHKAVVNLRKLWINEPVFSFTIDVDWASEDAIKFCYRLFEKYQIPVTFFLTHSSKFLTEKIEKGKIGAGIHPNFIKGSNHGNSIEEVINYSMKLLPKVECFRCHRYYDVNDVTEAFYNLGIRYDSNLCTFLDKVNPFVHRSGIIRFPVYFEDGAYLLHKQNLLFNEVKTELFSSSGLMVINVHPMHLVMNTPNFQYSRTVKDSLSRQKWNSLNYNDFYGLNFKGLGIRDYIINLLDFVKENQFKTYTLHELYKRVGRANV